ncbi:E3 ubiquitin-protein ligase trul-1-like [Musca vetustissima]|uniref:E3 ubiquitin-protein ligase trul-1-like n=1 Tax=Musca vetustissima TaxID=27455 RepID=UPI002AB6CE3D|nr:E3 ubiquitin-protein ligase trul-1-like [Musca vetustissima]
MSVLDSKCTVCMEPFNNTGVIATTNCGHIFHDNCLQNWQLQTPKCPQCEAYKPFSHVVYLNFDETIGDAKQLQEIHQQTSDELENLKKLHKEKSLVWAKMQAAIQNEVHEFKTLVSKLRHDIVCLEAAGKKNRQKICALTEEICSIETESENRIAELRKEVDTLKDTLENYSTELAVELSKQNEKSTTTNDERPMIHINLTNDKIKDLEEQLQHVTKELENEITRNSELEIENMKLKKLSSIWGELKKM